MKLGVTLDILNQKDTPAFYADTLANRPAAGFTGRVFISTDTLDLYRDTGTTWVLLSPSSTGTITGSGAAGQVTFFSAASSITGSNNLFWDNTNGHLGIKTITPDCALDVNHDGAFVAKFNNTTSANTLLGIYNADNPQWLIGSNNVADDLIFYDATNSPTLVPTTTMKIDGTIFIGGQNTGSGRLNVYSATGDNGIQISGANAPSLRIDNAPTGATKRIGFGISTATNNFIQGSTDRDMCIFNGSTTASPMLFGIYDTTNVQEAARISAARNFIVGSSVDAGYKFDVNGAARVTGVIYADNSIRVANAIIGTNSNSLLLSSNTTGGEISFWNGGLANRLMTLTGAGNLGLGTNTPDVSGFGWKTLTITGGTTSGSAGIIELQSPTTNTNGQNLGIITFLDGVNRSGEIRTIRDTSTTTGNMLFYTNAGAGIVERMRITSSGNIGIGVTPNGWSGFNAIQFGNNFSISPLGTTKNAYFNGSDYIYISSNYASLFQQVSNGSFAFYNATSGSAGNTISFIQAMTLEATGNLLIGTTTDNGSKLQVAGRTSITNELDCNNTFYFRKLTYSTIASGGSETQNIAFPSSNARKSLQVVVTAVDVTDAAIIQLKFDIIARWSGGSSLINSGIGNINNNFSRGIGDFTGTSNLTPSLSSSGNILTLVLTNSAAGNITNINVNITENYT